jgi:hypothetical protein
MCNVAHCRTLEIMNLKNLSKYRKENRNLLKNVLGCLGPRDKPSHAAMLQEEEKL